MLKWIIESLFEWKWNNNQKLFERKLQFNTFNSNNLSNMCTQKSRLRSVTNFKSNTTYLHTFVCCIHVLTHKNMHTHKYMHIITHRKKTTTVKTAHELLLSCAESIVCVLLFASCTSIECYYFCVYCNWEKRSGNSVQGNCRKICKVSIITYEKLIFFYCLIVIKIVSIIYIFNSG